MSNLRADLSWIFGIGKLVNSKSLQGIQLHLSRSFCWCVRHSCNINDGWIVDQQDRIQRIGWMLNIDEDWNFGNL